MFHLTGACPHCLTEARKGMRQLRDVCVEVKHTTYETSFEPLERDVTYSDLEAYRYYSCSHVRSE